ncbi:MAG: hypothetical protein AB7S74_17505 [Hyphomicrobium sp.]
MKKPKKPFNPMPPRFNVMNKNHTNPELVAPLAQTRDDAAIMDEVQGMLLDSVGEEISSLDKGASDDSGASRGRGRPRIHGRRLLDYILILIDVEMTALFSNQSSLKRKFQKFARAEVKAKYHGIRPASDTTLDRERAKIRKLGSSRRGR